MGLLIFSVGWYYGPVFSPYQPLENLRASLFSKISHGGSLFSEFKNFYRLTARNLALEDENKKLLSRLASLADTQEENSFLRKALDLPYAKNFEFIDARVFNVQFNPEGHIFLVNKGSNENIKSGDVVITGSGILVGEIAETFDNYSRAVLASHLNFKVTAKILGRDVSGMARGALNEEMVLDFIAQSDEIKERDSVVTKGNDMFPAGLLIGKVVKINSDNAELFKKIFIETSVSSSAISRVLILKKLK